MKRLLVFAAAVLITVGCSNQPTTTSTASSDSSQTVPETVMPNLEPIEDTGNQSPESVEPEKANSPPDLTSNDLIHDASPPDPEPAESTAPESTPEPTVPQLMQQAGQAFQRQDSAGATELLKKVLEKDPTHRVALLAIAQSTQSTGVQTLMPDPTGQRSVEDPELIDKGYSCFLESADYIRRLAKNYPELREGERRMMANVLYNEACAYSVIKKDKEKAVKSLQAAVAAGFSDAQLLGQDPDLALIRETPEFKAVAEQLSPKDDPEPPKDDAKKDGENKDDDKPAPAKDDPEPKKDGDKPAPPKDDPEPKKDGDKPAPSKDDPEPKKDGDKPKDDPEKPSEDPPKDGDQG